jgi:predicted dehydrogenase
MNKLKVGIIGTGFIGKQHVEAIRRIPGTEIVAISDSNEAMAKLVSEQLDIPVYYTDYREMLKDESIGIIHNCTPNAMHYSINKDIINAGKHVYCEKPLTLTSAEANELVQLARKKNVASSVNYNYRQNAMVCEMSERIKHNMIGKPLMVYGEYLQDWLLYDTDYDWRIDPEVGGASRAIADIGSHCFDTLQYVLGKKIVAVYAQLITAYPIRKKMEKIGGTFADSGNKLLEEIPVHSEDAAFILVKFEDNTAGLIQVSQVCAGKKNGLKVTINGSNAALEWEQENPDKLHIGHRDMGNEMIFADSKYLTGFAKQFATLPNGHAVAWSESFRNGIEAFYHAIREESYMEKSQRYTTFEDGLYIMKLIEACLESDKRKEWVCINDIYKVIS